MCPSGDKWSVLWWINAKVPQPHTHGRSHCPHITSVHHQYPKSLYLWQQITIPQTTTHSHLTWQAPSQKDKCYTQVRQQGQVMELGRLQGKHNRQPAWKQLKALGRALPEILLTMGQYHREVKRGWKYPFSLPFLSPCLDKKLSTGTTHKRAQVGKGCGCKNVSSKDILQLI